MAMIAVMLLIAAALRDWLGEAGVIAGAVVAGFVDPHSAAISVASLAASAKLAPLQAVMPILAAMKSDAIAKIVMAVGAASAGSPCVSLRPSRCRWQRPGLSRYR